MPPVFIVKRYSLGETAVLVVGASNSSAVGIIAITNQNFLCAISQISEKGYFSFLVEGESLTKTGKLRFTSCSNDFTASVEEVRFSVVDQQTRAASL